MASGDLDPVAGAGPVFDSFVEAAVKRFQARHGLGQTGVVNEATFAELNVPAAARLQQLETNIVRLRAYSGDLGARFVMVNIPAASVETVENGVVYSHHAAGVGKIDRQSPIMQTKATEINFNPFWTVPPSLIKKDLIPKMKADPELSDGRKDSRLQQRRPGGLSRLDQLEHRRGDAIQVSPGHGRRPQFARLRAHQHSEPVRRLHARHAVEGHFRRRLPLRFVGLRARAGRARLCRLAA